MTKAQFNRINKKAQIINGAEVFFLPLHFKAYIIDLNGQRWIFINSRLRRKMRTQLIQWGIKFTGETGVQG